MYTVSPTYLQIFTHSFDQVWRKNIIKKYQARRSGSCLSNPSYSRGGDWEDDGLRSAWAKVSKTPLQPIKSWKWENRLVIPTTGGSVNRRVTVQASHMNVRPYLKNNQSKKGLVA
jgi:hypothetical protein